MQRRHVHPAPGVTVPTRAMTIRCALGHTWQGTYTVYNRGVVRQPGKRPHCDFESVYEPACCSTCGQKAAGGQPLNGKDN